MTTFDRTTFDRITVDERDDRVVVTLNRPGSRNAIDLEMGTELAQVCAGLEAHPKPLLLAGSGGFFAAGADIAQLLERGRHEALLGLNSSLFRRIYQLPMPTVAAIDGPALGGGAELAFSCDLRVGSTRARFASPEPQLGIIAGAGATWLLPRLVGEPLARRVLLAGHVIEAQEALATGLLATVVEPEETLDAAHELIDRMSTMSAIALRLTKYVLNSEGAHPSADLLANALLFEDEQKQKRMQAFLDRRSTRVEA